MNGSNCRLRSTSVDLDRDGKPAPSVRHGSLPSSAKSKIKDAALTSRRRALSVAAAEPSAETIIIVKAKRAAQYLWTLLHAQNCVLVGNCPHPGCQEAKLIHLHLKTCSAGTDFSCPSNYHGCHEARKLLAHYRRCKGIRARQAGQIGGRREVSQPNCLICTLVARQAKTVLLDAGSPNKVSVIHGAKGKSHTVPSVAFCVDSAECKASDTLTGEKGMPPPPPRSMTSTNNEVYPGSKKLEIRVSYAPYINEPSRSSTDPAAGSSGDDFVDSQRTHSGRERACSHEDSSSVLGNTDNDGVSARARSTSLGGLPSTGLPSHGSLDPTCDTIAEEGSQGSRDTSEVDFSAIS